jgi:hypothetical protein
MPSRAPKILPLEISTGSACDVNDRFDITSLSRCLRIPPVSLAFLALWIVKASKGERYKLPFIGNFAEQQAG